MAASSIWAQVKRGMIEPESEPIFPSPPPVSLPPASDYYGNRCYAILQHGSEAPRVACGGSVALRLLGDDWIARGRQLPPGFVCLEGAINYLLARRPGLAEVEVVIR